MKTSLIAALCTAALLASAVTPGRAQAAAELSAEQREELVSPIALYPDALVALILPAATRPSDIVLAARFLERGGHADATATLPWQDSVKALTRYPELLAYLDENLAWTQDLGELFLAQPDAVMDTIQTLRDRALKHGLLTDTAQHTVIVEDGLIRIVPARPTVIHVPRYDPEVLHVTRVRTYHHGAGPFISFGLGYGIGSWLAYDCDWRHRSVIVVHRPAVWYHYPDWRVRHYHSVGWTWSRWSHGAYHRPVSVRVAPPPPRPVYRQENRRTPERTDWRRADRPPGRNEERRDARPHRRDQALTPAPATQPAGGETNRWQRREPTESRREHTVRPDSRPTRVATQDNHAYRRSEPRSERPARTEARAERPPRSRDDIDTKQREQL